MKKSIKGDLFVAPKTFRAKYLFFDIKKGNALHNDIETKIMS